MPNTNDLRENNILHLLFIYVALVFAKQWPLLNQLLLFKKLYAKQQLPNAAHVESQHFRFFKAIQLVVPQKTVPSRIFNVANWIAESIYWRDAAQRTGELER